jgi:hypothetical protein
MYFVCLILAMVAKVGPAGRCHAGLADALLNRDICRSSLTRDCRIDPTISLSPAAGTDAGLSKTYNIATTYRITAKE